MQIILKDFNLGGLADSEFQGVANSVSKMVGFDIHSEPGILKVNQKLVNEQTGDDFIVAIVPCSDGNTYLFGGELGKIYKRLPDGTYSHEATNASGKIMDAVEFDGYIYYSSTTAIGRWQIGTAWSGRNDNFGAFTNDDNLFHPLFVLNLVLYIGDGNLVAQVEDNIFVPDALDLPKGYRIKSIGQGGNDLVIGTYVSDNVNKTQIFRWNTWSVSWSVSDTVPEVGINSFLQTDNYILVQAGQKGNLYVYTGETLEKHKRIPGNWRTGLADVRQNASDSYFGLPLFGLSNISGNPVLQGVYSYGSYATNYPSVLNLEYVLANGHTSDVSIGAVRVVGNDLLVSWKDGAGRGVDRVDMNNKYSGAYLETRKINMIRENLKNIGATITWRSTPTPESIKLWESVNDETYREIKLTYDPKRKISYTAVNIGAGSTVKYKLTTTAVGNDAPEIESVILDIK